jgi:phosphatidylglycerol:prolipoprotein diacylglycerol transferase
MGVVGGRIFHVLFDGFFWDYVHLCTEPTKVGWEISKELCESPRYAEAQPQWDAVAKVCRPTVTDCFAWAKFWAGGLTYYGGFLFAAVAGVLLLKRDLASVGIAIGLGFGRIGCFLAGCCFGDVSHGTHALSFPPRSPASDQHWKQGLIDHAGEPSLPVLPTQAFESAMSFAVAGFLLLYLQGRKRYDGQIFVWFLGLYALGRFVIEFWRADDRGGALGLSTSQLIGLLIVAFAFVLHQKLDAAAPSPPSTGDRATAP